MPVRRRTFMQFSSGKRLWAIAIGLSLVVLISGRFPVAPVRDAATLQGASDVYLGRPDAYVAFAPFSDVLDMVSLLSERQHVAVVLGLILIWSLARLARRGGRRINRRDSLSSFAILQVSLATVYVGAAYLPRPMAHLESVDPDLLRIDFHSHTHSSKDARRSYSVEHNRAWHEVGGYDVAYVTDHDTFTGAERGLANDPAAAKEGVMLLGGIEVSWRGEHIGLLGAEPASRHVLSPDLHDIDLPDPAIAGHRASAPILVWNHPRDPHLKSLPLAMGAVQAIEIANGALHGMDLVRWKREQIVALARQENLALLSGTDSHGWGYAAPNWTLLRIKGWRRLDREQLAAQIERTVRVGGFRATHVVERTTADPATSTTALALSLIVVPWRMLTTLSPEERWMWLVWTWGIASLTFQLRSRRIAGYPVPAAAAGAAQPGRGDKLI
jgi:hypothetical protein